MKVTIKCNHCGIEVLKEKRNINHKIAKGKSLYCSKKCFGLSHTEQVKVICAQCCVEFTRTPSCLKDSVRFFCTQSCAATYNNKNKKHGTRRSKIETLVEERIKQKYTTLRCLCNSKQVIGSELDFYFPDLKMGIEINGIFHYKPVYGDDKLKKIQAMDKEKLEKSLAKGIDIKVIDCQHDKYLNKALQEKRINDVTNMIDLALASKLLLG